MKYLCLPSMLRSTTMCAGRCCFSCASNAPIAVLSSPLSLSMTPQICLLSSSAKSSSTCSTEPVQMLLLLLVDGQSAAVPLAPGASVGGALLAIGRCRASTVAMAGSKAFSSLVRCLTTCSVSVRVC